MNTTIIAAGVLFFATLIRSAFGFGEALIAVPLLALFMPVQWAAPVAVLVSITVALIVVIQDWQKVHLRSAAALVIPTLVGIPLGLVLLRAVAEPVVKGLLGAIIIVFSAHSLWSRKQQALTNDRLAWLFGFGAGVLGGAYGMNGPPLVIYGSMRGWSPQHFRATLQGYFLPASIVGMCGYGVAGLWTPAVNRLYFVSLPCVLLATWMGRRINQRMNAHRFLRYVHCGLIAIAVTLLIQAARAG